MEGKELPNGPHAAPWVDLKAPAFTLPGSFCMVLSRHYRSSALGHRMARQIVSELLQLEEKLL